MTLRVLLTVSLVIGDLNSHERHHFCHPVVVDYLWETLYLEAQ